MKRLKRIAVVLFAGSALGGCTSDPAFWEAVAMGLDQAAYDLANEPVCNWYTGRDGIVRQHCVPAYAANAPVYVPDYSRHGRDGHRDRGRDRRDHDRHNRDHDRRDHRRGPKG